MRWWDWLVVEFNGKDVAVLGPRYSGKTHLHHVLLHGAVPTGHREQTMTTESTGWTRAAGLNIHKGVDLPGSVVWFPDWELQFQKSEIVFYLFDTHKLRVNSKYATRVTEDSKMLRDWGIGNKRVYVLGTHADTDPECKRLGMVEYSDSILDLNDVIGLRNRVQAKAQAVASLLTAQETLDAVRSLVRN